MDEHEIRTAKIVRISSHDRTSDSKSQYDFKIATNDYFLNQIRKVIVKSVSIPNTQYNVSTVNDTLTYDIGGGDTSVSIPVGQYASPSDVLDALAASLLAGPDAIVMTHTVDALTAKAELTFGVPIILKRGTNGAQSEVGTSTIAHVIGLGDVDTASLLVHQMPDLPDLSGLKKVYVSSAVLSSTSSTVSSNRVQSNVYTEVSMDVPFGYYKHRTVDDMTTSDERTVTVPNNLSTIDIKLLDEKLRPVDLNGHDCYISLKVFS